MFTKITAIDATPLMVASAFGFVVAATAVNAEPPGLEVADLKQAYLECERAAQSNGLDAAGIVACSMIYQNLKRQGFGGSYRLLHEWYDAQPKPWARPGESFADASKAMSYDAPAVRT